MKKRGFTLVELLAVIAILAILVIIALPNVMSLFNEAKKNSFITEVKQIAKSAEQQWISDSMFETKEVVYCRAGGVDCAKSIKLSGRKEIDYYIRVNKSGKIVEYYVTDGTHQYTESNAAGLSLQDIKDADNVVDLSQENVITINSNGTVTTTQGVLSGSTTSPTTTQIPDNVINQLDLLLTYVWDGRTNTMLTMSINGSSTVEGINEVEYVIYKAQEIEFTQVYGESSYLTTVKSTNKSQSFSETIDTGFDRYGFKFNVDVYVNGQKILTKETGRYWCFVAGTKVKTKTGFKNIEDIKVGEKVYSYNLDTNELELKTVTKTIQSEAKETIKIKIDNKTLEMSDRHELYIIDKGWVRAYNLKVGDEMLDADGKVVTISEVKRIKYDEAIPTYNLTVDGNHNYFVTDIQVLVHNVSSPSPD